MVRFDKETGSVLFQDKEKPDENGNLSLKIACLDSQSLEYMLPFEIITQSITKNMHLNQFICIKNTQ